MGGEAIIVSTQEGIEGGGCRITAAIEEERHAEPDVNEPEPADPEHVAELVRQILISHGTPPALCERLARTARVSDQPDAPSAIKLALSALFTFRALKLSAQKAPIILAGPPGAGKTITAAKLAAEAKVAGQSVFVATTDTKRAGGVEQLEAFTRILEIDLIVAPNASAMRDELPAPGGVDVTVIDTGGVNPFYDEDMQALTMLADKCGAELVFVLPAGGDALDCADMAAAFQQAGAKRMIVTRLEMTRRYGSILAAAHAGSLAFAGATVSAQVAENLNELSAHGLTRLIAPTDSLQRPHGARNAEAAL